MMQRNWKRYAKYFSVASYQGNCGKDIYTVIKLVNTEALDHKISEDVRSGFMKTLEYFKKHMDTNNSGNIVIDMKGINRIDPSGVGTILALNRINKDNYGRPIKLVNCQEGIDYHLKIVNLGEIVDMIPNLDEL